jgi:hypothetical protein
MLQLLCHSDLPNHTVNTWCHSNLPNHTVNTWYIKLPEVFFLNCRVQVYHTETRAKDVPVRIYVRYIVTGSDRKTPLGTKNFVYMDHIPYVIFIHVQVCAA